MNTTKQYKVVDVREYHGNSGTNVILILEGKSKRDRIRISSNHITNYDYLTLIVGDCVEVTTTVLKYSTKYDVILI